MTDNLPAVRDEAPVAVVDTDSWIPVASDFIRLANLISPTEFVPDTLRDKPEAVAAAMLYGREVGLPPMTSLNMTDVIKGKPTINAEAMRMLILAAGHELEFVDSNTARCELRGRRRGSNGWTTVVWTMDDARNAGLRGDNWTKYPRRMLQARASSEIAEMMFADVIHGFRASEVMSDEEGDAESTPTATGTKVGRKRATRKNAAPSVPAPLEDRPAALTGPPLPGEEGYEETSAGEVPPSVPAPVEEIATSPADAQTTDTGSGGPGVEGETEEPAVGEGEGEALTPAAGPEDGGGEAAPDRGGSGAAKPKRARYLSRAQQRGIEAALTDLDVDADRDERHLIAGTILGRKVETMKSLTFDEASTLLDTFARIETRAQLDALLDAADKARAEAATKEAELWNPTKDET